jgi:hypothetical protein
VEKESQENRSPGGTTQYSSHRLQSLRKTYRLEKTTPWQRSEPETISGCTLMHTTVHYGKNSFKVRCVCRAIQGLSNNSSCDTIIQANDAEQKPEPDRSRSSNCQSTVASFIL